MKALPCLYEPPKRRSANIATLFEEVRPVLTPADIIEAREIVRKVYKEQAASAFMASLAPFILSRRGHEYVGGLLERCLDSFMRRSLSRYPSYASDADAAHKVGVVGSFGCACEDILREIGSRYDMEFVKFIKSPVDELVAYHKRNQ